ncbi:uncharacterized protein RAG0_00015 [Rhynchosporium agropyri]|uniref:Uncharacterized protein n=1 Tax=Rhynchosporium agropyri TaxID=914238 RepID=A0A1E1JR03_9HELO|nr:uncharacterized protein RAG0_00015 [Rhynchosporium agropyri]
MTPEPTRTPREQSHDEQATETDRKRKSEILQNLRQKSTKKATEISAGKKHKMSQTPPQNPTMSFIARKTESHGSRFDHCDDCKRIPSLSPSPSPVALLTDSNHETAVRPSGSRRKENLRQGTSTEIYDHELDSVKIAENDHGISFPVEVIIIISVLKTGKVLIPHNSIALYGGILS